MFSVRRMMPDDVEGAVALQRTAFPPPFSEDLHWDPSHLYRHIEVFPDGQFVAVVDDLIVGSCSNTLISEAQWQKHASWGETVGGPNLAAFDATGSTMYGLDITVHPDYRRAGIGRTFYTERYRLVKERGLVRYGTGCRIPDYRRYKETHPEVTVEEYVKRVVRGETTDRTLTPLLRFGLTSLGVVHDYMQDEESADAAALLEWLP